MPLDHFTRLCESYNEDCNKISPLDHFAHSCKKFAWLCQILKNSIANTSLCLISHHYAKIDPHAKTFHLFPTIFKILYLRKIYSRSQDIKEVEDHLCLFLFHSHSLIFLPCPRPHTLLGTLIFFLFFFFEYFLGTLSISGTPSIRFFTLPSLWNYKMNLDWKEN